MPVKYCKGNKQHYVRTILTIQFSFVIQSFFLPPIKIAPEHSFHFFLLSTLILVKLLSFCKIQLQFSNFFIIFSTICSIQSNIETHTYQSGACAHTCTCMQPNNIPVCSTLHGHIKSTDSTINSMLEAVEVNIRLIVSTDIIEHGCDLEKW